MKIPHMGDFYRSGEYRHIHLFSISKNRADVPVPEIIFRRSEIEMFRLGRVVIPKEIRRTMRIREGISLIWIEAMIETGKR